MPVQRVGAVFVSRAMATVKKAFSAFGEAKFSSARFVLDSQACFGRIITHVRL